MKIASPAAAAEKVTVLKRLWQRLAQALDHLVANRARRHVPAAALRRSRHDLDRCRQLMLRGQPVPVKAANPAASRRVMMSAQR